MPIVSAVLVVEPRCMSAASASLQSDPRVTVGAPTGDRLPIVLETSSHRDDSRFWRSLKANHLIKHHQIVFADVSDVSKPQQTEVSS